MSPTITIGLLVLLTMLIGGLHMASAVRIYQQRKSASSIGQLVWMSALCLFVFGVMFAAYKKSKNLLVLMLSLLSVCLVSTTVLNMKEDNADLSGFDKGLFYIANILPFVAAIPMTFLLWNLPGTI